MFIVENACSDRKYLTFGKKKKKKKDRERTISVILPLFDWQALNNERKPGWTSEMMHAPHSFAHGHWSHFQGLRRDIMAPT